MSNHAPQRANGSPLRKPWFQVSKTKIAAFLGLYGFSFLVCRFDIRKHHLFQDPMTNRNAGVWGFVLTIVVWGIGKV